MHNDKHINAGSILIQVIAFIAISAMLLSGLIGWGVMSVRIARQAEVKAEAGLIAESGIEYYRWHLAHDPIDFWDGQGATSTGPYTHEYADRSGANIGRYQLAITPPVTGSSIVTVKSTGWTYNNPQIKRTFAARFAKPSYTKYIFATEASTTYYGTGDDVYGEIYSNGVLRFNSPAKAHSIITSALATGTISGPMTVWGASCTGDPTPPTMYTAASCPNILMSGRRTGAPRLDFSALSLDMSRLRDKAQSGGNYHAGSGGNGYHVVLKTNDTYDLYRVTQVYGATGGCSNVRGESDWGLWSVRTQAYVGNYAFPSNGIIFLADHVWVDGQITTAHITVAAARNIGGGSTNANIIVNNDLLYSSRTGSEAVGLVAEGNFFIGLYSEDDLEIDAAIMAQQGAARRNYYSSSNCSGTYYTRAKFTLFGSMISKGQAYFYQGSNQGYRSQPVQYDGNLLYSPPPSFPLTTDEYQLLSWDEL